MPELTPEAWAQIRHDYEHTDRLIDDICAEHGISSGTLRDRVRRWRWTRRRAPIPPEGPPPLPAPPREERTPRAVPFASQAADDALPPAAAPNDAPGADANAAPADPALIGTRLQGAAARVLPAIEAVVAKLAAGPIEPREMERAGRALGTLTRTLRELHALLAQYPVPNPDDDRGPEDNDEFLRELARRMDYFAALPSGEETGGAQPPQSGSQSLG